MTLSQPYSLYTTAAWLKIGDGAAAAKKLLCDIMAMIKTGKYGIHGIIMDMSNYWIIMGRPWEIMNGQWIFWVNYNDLTVLPHYNHI